MLTLKIPDDVLARTGITNVHEALARLERGVSPNEYRAERDLASQLEVTRQKLSEAEAKLKTLEAAKNPPKPFRATRGFARHGSPRY